MKLERVILYLWAINSWLCPLSLKSYPTCLSGGSKLYRQWYGRHAISNKCRSRSDNKSRASYRLPDKPQRKALVNNFCINFVRLVISLLHIHRILHMAVHVHHHHFLFFPSLISSLFTLGLKPTFFTSLSHHRLLVLCPWTAFLVLDCFSGHIMRISFIFLSLFLFSFWSRVAD